MGSALYSDFQLGIIHTETEKAYFATIFKLTDNPVRIPKSVVEPKTMKLKNWFIDQLQHELKTNKQTTLADYFNKSSLINSSSNPLKIKKEKR